MRGLPLQLQVTLQSMGADANANDSYSAIVRYPFFTNVFSLKELPANFYDRVLKIRPSNLRVVLIMTSPEESWEAQVLTYGLVCWCDELPHRLADPSRGSSITLRQDMGNSETKSLLCLLTRRGAVSAGSN